MTVPGVYSPEQLQAHVDKVIASDGEDDSRAVEVMARAIDEAITGERGVYVNSRVAIIAARAALGALRALEGEN